MLCLSEADRKSILEIARQAVVEAVCREHVVENIPKTGVFGERRGVFVSLHVGGRLRGCIGIIESVEPLGESIQKCAASAATEDPRFGALQPKEVPDVEIEVSLLSPLQRIQPEEIEIGKHGLLVEQGLHRGLLLPQVAVEHHLEREEFLSETCGKAGLAKDAWRAPETRVYAFTCEIVGEGKRGRKEEARAGS
jgi:AmmeMemoRadiSam system protein A